MVPLLHSELPESNSLVVQPGEGGPTREAVRNRPEPTGGVAGGSRGPEELGEPGDPEKSDDEEASVDEEEFAPLSLAHAVWTA